MELTNPLENPLVWLLLAQKTDFLEQYSMKFTKFFETVIAKSNQSLFNIQYEQLDFSIVLIFLPKYLFLSYL